MDTDQIRRLEPMLIQFLNHFDDCFGRKDTRAHLGVSVRGQLSELPEKSVEPLALEADVAPRTLQEFLSQLKWEGDRVRDRLQRLVAAEHQGPHTIGLFDRQVGRIHGPGPGRREPPFDLGGGRSHD